MSLQALLSHWRAEPTIAENIIEWRTLPTHLPRFVPFPDDLHPALIQTLQERGIAALYTHQSAAWEHLQNGRHPVIVTGTASGKTLAYNLPVLNYLLRDSNARALYLFPTKALAQDQWKEIQRISESVSRREEEWANQRIDESASQPSPIHHLSSAIYDGDTPAHARHSIRANARLILSNPDMLHTGILPHHTAWAEFFRNLCFVVIDEMHIYRGVFGSHVANVIRRLKRITQFYGARPQFILTSATIANPAQLAERLIEEPVAVVDDDGSARGPRHFLIFNPPLVDSKLGVRRSSLLESVRLTEDLLAYNVQTILFGKTRRAVEVMLTYLREKTPTPIPSPEVEQERGEQSSPPQKVERRQEGNTIRGYRSGYLPSERRAIERGLRTEEVRGVVATTALELGIDIGGMGAAVLAGYPGTIAATRQQAGRAGRGSAPSLAVLVTSALPLDQFLAQHPEYFFERSPERALINPDNLLILLGHIRCAAFELPFRNKESFGRVSADQLEAFLQFLQDSGVLHQSGEKYFWMTDKYPAEGLSLRSASANRVVLQSLEEGKPKTIGDVDLESAAWMVHPQAVYLHEAQTYFVEDLDLTQNIAYLSRQSLDYYTEPLHETRVQLRQISARSSTHGAMKSHGEITVTALVKGFRKIRWFTHETLGHGDLSLPPTELQTTGYWLALADETVAILREQGLWSNAPNDYGSQWEQLSEMIRTRDGFRCQLCGMPEGNRAHDVHHKIPFRSFTSREQANQHENLITLCTVCHRRVEIAVRVRSGLAGLAYVLLNLAPLFLMCDTRDLGVHSDPQSPLG